jgi:hypothetical protein
MALNDIKVPKENASGTFDEVVLTGTQIGLEKPATGDASSTQVVLGNDTRLSDARTPSSTLAHASSHASAGSDPLAPSSIGAQSLFTGASQVLSADFTLTSGRATKWTLQNYNGTTYNVTLPTTDVQVGDVVVVISGTLVGSQTIREANIGGGSFVALATLSEGQSYRFISNGTSSNSWEIDSVYTHTHPASAITDSTTAGRALLTGADAAAQRTSLGLGTAATSATGDFAAASHSHGNLTTDGKVGSTSGLPLVTTTAGAVTTLALGTAGQVLRTKSDLSGVEFADPSGGGVTGAASSAADVLGVSGANITGVDAGSDKIVFWDDSASELTYLTVGSGLSLTDTTLTATATGGGTKTYAVFTAEHNQPPSTAFATLDTRNSIAVLDFDAATDENAVFVGIMPEAASLGSGLIVRLHWMATTATSGNVRWGVQFERSNTDLDADSFDTAVEATAAANGTSGILTTTAITVTTIDGITAGDVFRLKVFRNADDATNDTMTGDAELVAVEVRSAA